MKLSAILRKTVRRLIAFYPPFFFSGIGVKRLTVKPLSYKTTLKKRWWNQNAVGTHFGGSLFSMTDPFIMLILISELGSDYVVWDKSSSIEFLIASKRPVSASHSVSAERLEEIRQNCTDNPYLPEFTIDITDENGEIVARVRKTIYIRKKRRISTNL